MAERQSIRIPNVINQDLQRVPASLLPNTFATWYFEKPAQAQIILPKKDAEQTINDIWEIILLLKVTGNQCLISVGRGFSHQEERACQHWLTQITVVIVNKEMLIHTYQYLFNKGECNKIKFQINILIYFSGQKNYMLNCLFLQVIVLHLEGFFKNQFRVYKTV